MDNNPKPQRNMEVLAVIGFVLLVLAPTLLPSFLPWVQQASASFAAASMQLIFAGDPRDVTGDGFINIADVNMVISGIGTLVPPTIVPTSPTSGTQVFFPTNTSTPTVTFTPTRTMTADFESTATFTPTPTYTFTPTAFTPTATFTPTPTYTFTPTATFTPTPED